MQIYKIPHPLSKSNRVVLFRKKKIKSIIFPYTKKKKKNEFFLK